MTVVSYHDAARELAAIRKSIKKYTSFGFDRPSTRDLIKATWEPKRDPLEPHIGQSGDTYDNYATEQQKALNGVVKSALRGFANWQATIRKKSRRSAYGTKTLDPTKVSLFLTGSAAKLEFFPGSSDVDFLAILHSSNTSSEARARRDQWSNQFAELKKQLATAIKSNRIVNSNKKVTLSGAPNGAAKTFLTPADIIGHPERDTEPNWAASFRAQLLTEARSIHRAPGCDKVVIKTQKHYCASLDLAEGLYPLLSTRLLLSFSISGVLGQAIQIRRESLSGTRNEDIRVMKAIISREWNSAINLLTLHIFYWQAVTEEAGRKRSAERISRVLTSAPLHQLCVNCPEELNYLTRADVCKKLRTRLARIGIAQSEINRIVGSPARVSEQSRYHMHSGPLTEIRNGRTANVVEYNGGLLQKLKEHLSPSLSDGKESKPLWISYLDAMDLYREIRIGKSKSLDKNDIDRLMQWTKRFSSVLDIANDITRVIMEYDMTHQLLSGSKTLNGYKKLARCYAVSRLLS